MFEHTIHIDHVGEVDLLFGFPTRTSGLRMALAIDHRTPCIELTQQSQVQYF